MINDIESLSKKSYPVNESMEPVAFIPTDEMILEAQPKPVQETPQQFLERRTRERKEERA